MTKREFLKSEILKFVQEELLPYEFKLNKASEEFTQKIKDGWNKYQIVFLKRDDGWELKPGMLIRRDSVENIFHRTSGFETKHQKGTPTIGASVEDYLEDRQNYRLDLTDESQINEAAERLVTIFRQVALPFFEKYISLEAIEEEVNRDPYDTKLTGDIFKGSKGLILAKLTGRPDYVKLVEIYTRHYQTFADGFYSPEFDKLVEDLRRL